MIFKLLAYRTHGTASTLSPGLLFGRPVPHVHVGDGRRYAPAEPLAAHTAMTVAWLGIQVAKKSLEGARADEFRPFTLRVN